MDNETARKSEEILRAILAHCNSRLAAGEEEWAIAFGPDWGESSLTIYDPKHGHTHVGGVFPEDTFEELIDQLHAQLVQGRGLSWAGNHPGRRA
jgi:hypothetical protein